MCVKCTCDGAHVGEGMVYILVLVKDRLAFSAWQD